MLSNIQWRRGDRETSLRPLRGFTTGKLFVNGSAAHVETRFTDQNLANRFSDHEEDGVPVTLQVTLLGGQEVYLFSGDDPTLERSGACYVLRVWGDSDDVTAVDPVL